MKIIRYIIISITTVRFRWDLKYWVSYLYMVFRYHFEVWLNRDIHLQIKHLPMLLKKDTFWVKRERVKYSFISPPSKIIQVDQPWWKYSLAMDRVKKPWFVYDGDWDNNNLEKRETIYQMISNEHISSGNYNKITAIIHNTVHSIFVLGDDFKKSEQYKIMRETIKNPVSMNNDYNCNTLKDIDEYFRKLIFSFYSMKKHGYLTQKELRGCNDDEIPIYINRNGEFCQNGGGLHRVRFAEILNIEYVPINLRGLHFKFVKNLCEKYKLPPHKAIKKWISTESELKVKVK